MQFGLYSAENNKKSSMSYFYGLNRTRRPKRGEFTEMYNMSSGEYPCISPRNKRSAVFTAPGEIQAAVPPDSTNVSDITAFTGIADEVFYYNGKRRSGSYVLYKSFVWEIIRTGNLYIINGFMRGDEKSHYSAVMYYYNTDTDTFGVANKRMDNLIICASKDGDGNYISTFRFGFDAVREYTVTVGDTQIDNQDFYDLYANGRVLPGTNIFSDMFSAGEEITISGFPTDEENVGQIWSYNTSNATVVPQTNQDFSYNNTVDPDAYITLAEINKHVIVRAVIDSFKVTNMSVDGITSPVHKMYVKLYNRDGDEIDFDDMSGTIKYFCSGAVIQKRTRRFDNISFHNGRIWGTIPNGNMIYASASDDIFSFSSEDILAKFAVRLTSDTPGTFTAMCEYNGDLILFKENSVTVVYGNSTASYGMHVINGVGCTDKRSVAVTPEGVIFLSYGGFYIYSGGVPVCISQKLNRRYRDAVSGFDGDIYYACVTDGDRKVILAYDMRYSVWHEYDELAVSGYFLFRDGFYIADGNTVYRTDTAVTDVGWSVTSVNLNEGTLDNKALNEIWIRAEVYDGASFSVETSVDGGAFRYHSKFDKPGMHIFRCPVRAVMGNSFRYRISGFGKAVFYEIELKYAEGGRKYKKD